MAREFSQRPLPHFLRLALRRGRAETGAFSMGGPLNLCQHRNFHPICGEHGGPCK